MTKSKLNYTESIVELEKILSELESNVDISMEDIALKVKKASQLMEFCKKQLHDLDEELEKVMDALND